MLRLLRFLLTGDGHLHHWVILNTNSVRAYNGDGNKGTMYTLQCELCGNIKRKQVNAS